MVLTKRELRKGPLETGEPREGPLKGTTARGTKISAVRWALSGQARLRPGRSTPMLWESKRMEERHTDKDWNQGEDKVSTLQAQGS